MNKNNLLKLPLHLYSELLKYNIEVIDFIKLYHNNLNEEAMNSIINDINKFNDQLILHQHIQDNLLYLIEHMNPLFKNHIKHHFYEQIKIDNKESLEYDCLDTICIWINDENCTRSITSSQLKNFYIFNDFDYVNNQYKEVIILPFFISFTLWFFQMKELSHIVKFSSQLSIEVKESFQEMIKDIDHSIKCLDINIDVEPCVLISKTSHFKNNILQSIETKDIHHIRAIEFFYYLFNNEWRRF